MLWNNGVQNRPWKPVEIHLITLKSPSALLNFVIHITNQIFRNQRRSARAVLIMHIIQPILEHSHPLSIFTFTHRIVTINLTNLRRNSRYCQLSCTHESNYTSYNTYRRSGWLSFLKHYKLIQLSTHRDEIAADGI